MEWTYKHEFGIVGLHNKLVLTEDKYFGSQHWEYNYYILGDKPDDSPAAFTYAKDLDKKFNLPRIMDSEESQNLLIEVQKLFPLANLINQEYRQKHNI